MVTRKGVIGVRRGGEKRLGVLKGIFGDWVGVEKGWRNRVSFRWRGEVMKRWF
jgi:hypothetical protein